VVGEWKRNWRMKVRWKVRHPDGAYSGKDDHGGGFRVQQTMSGGVDKVFLVADPTCAEHAGINSSANIDMSSRKALWWQVFLVADPTCAEHAGINSSANIDMSSRKALWWQLCLVAPYAAESFQWWHPLTRKPIGSGSHSNLMDVGGTLMAFSRAECHRGYVQ